MKQAKVHLASVAFATIFGFTFMFSKIALDYVMPIGLIAYRFLVAIVVFELLRRLHVVKITFSLERFKAVFWVALFQPVMYFLFEINGLARVPSGEAGMMIALIPVIATVLSAFILKEKPRLLQVFFIVLSVSGIVFIQASHVAGGVDFDAFGYALMFGAVVAAALFNIASRSASRNMKAHEITYYMMLFGAVVFNVLYVLMLMIQGRVGDYVVNLSQPELVLPVLYLGILASILAFFLVNFALSRLEVHVSSVYANLATVTAVVAGAVFLRETLYYYHFIGGAMIIVGVYGTARLNRGTRRFKQREPLKEDYRT